MVILKLNLKSESNEMTKVLIRKITCSIYTNISVENLVKCAKSLTGSTNNQHKPCELDMESDLYAPSRGPNIPF